MEVKGIGEKLFLSLKPYVVRLGPDHARRQGPLVVSFGPPRFLPGAGGPGETRQRRPGGQGTVTLPPARGPLGPGPSSHAAGFSAAGRSSWPDAGRHSCS